MPIEREIKKEIEKQAKFLEDPDFSATAAEKLGDTKRPEAIPSLVKALKNHPRTWTRQMAAYALGQIGHPKAIPALAEALQDPNEGVRCSAASALGNIRHSKAIPPLVKALEHPHDETRRSALWALGLIGDSKGIPHALRALKHPDSVTRKYAVTALRRISNHIQGMPAKNKESKALQLVGPYIETKENPMVVHKIYQAALKGEISLDDINVHLKILRKQTNA